MNALKTGLFARYLILPALDETAEVLESFRRAVSTDLDAVGTVERELADRIAIIMWRMRRVARSEVAAMSASTAPLPRDPDTITGEGVDTLMPLSPRASAAERLAYTRARLRCLPRHIAELREAAAALAADDGVIIAARQVQTVQSAADDLLQWMRDPDPWPSLLVALGCPEERVGELIWDGAFLRILLQAAAVSNGRDPDGFVSAVSERLQATVASTEQWLAQQHAEEATLVAQLTAEREQVAAKNLYADDAMIQSVARAEGHLGRELEHAFAMLARLQVRRVAESALPAELGSFRKGGD